MFNSGCSLPSSSDQKAPSRTITLTGDLVSPDVKIPGFLPSVFDSLVSSSTCTVNDIPVTYSIATDSTFTIINVFRLLNFNVLCVKSHLLSFFLAKKILIG